MIITVTIQDDHEANFPDRVVEFVCASDEEQETLVGIIFSRLQTIKHDIQAQKAHLKLDRTLEQDADRGF